MVRQSLLNEVYIAQCTRSSGRTFCRIVDDSSLRDTLVQYLICSIFIKREVDIDVRLVRRSTYIHINIKIEVYSYMIFDQDRRNEDSSLLRRSLQTTNILQEYDEKDEIQCDNLTNSK